MSGQHAFLPPSGAGAWVFCAMWPTMNALYPELGDQRAALDGEASHWAFAEILRDHMVALGQVAPNNVVLDQEMLDGAEMFVDFVDAGPMEPGWTFQERHVEERVESDAIHALNWGTPDTWEVWHDQTKGRLLIRLPDYKFGHDLVEVFENWQLLDYLALILAKLGIDAVLASTRGEVWVEFGVVQPRAHHRDGPRRIWKAQVQTLVPYFDRLRNAARAALEPNPVATPGPHCEHCPGRYACEPLQRGAYIAADLSQRSVPLDLALGPASVELRMLTHYKELLDARVSGLTEQVEHEVRGGKSAPHHRMALGTSKTIWLKSDAEVLALGQMFGKDLSKNSVKTPTQAVALGVDKTIVAAYSHTPPAGQKLVQDDGSLARKIFG